MPVYELDHTSSVDVTAKAAVQVTWLQTGGSAPIVIEALAADVEAPVRRPRPDLVVVPPSSAPVLLRAVPGVGVVFGTPTFLELQLLVQVPGSTEPQIVRLPGQDLSGLPARDLARIEQRDGATRISAVESGQAVPLGPVADRARAMARTLSGVDRLAAGSARPMTAFVDTSASMQPLFQDGSVTAALDLLVGIAQVVAPGGALTVCGVGAQPRWTGEHPPADQAAAVVRELSNGALVSGFRATELPESESDSLTYLITDGAPPGVDRGRVDWVVLMPPAAWAILTTGVEQDVCVIAPGGAESMLQDRGRIEQAVRALFAAVPHTAVVHGGGS